MPWGMQTIFPNMYIILCGPSAAGKGIAMGPAQDMLREIGIELSSDAITREALIRELASAAQTQPTEDDNPSFHSSLTVFSREFAVFIGSNNTQLMSDLCDWFDCADKWKYKTKTQGEDKILGVWVNICGATTPELLQTSLPRDAFGSGLMSRIIIVYVAKRGKTVAVPFLTKDEQELRQKLVYDLERIHAITGDFRMTKDSMEYWINTRHHMDSNPPFSDYRMDGYNGRRPHHTLKLSMIMSASRSDSRIIEIKDIDRALDILKECESQMLHAFAGVGKARLGETLVRVMSYLATIGVCTEDVLLTQFVHDVDMEDLNRILIALHKMGCISITSPEKVGGKRIIRYIKQEGL